MSDIRISVGYSSGIDDLKRILDASEKVSSVYTGGLSGKIAGGRPQYLENLDILRKSVQIAHDRGVLYEIALNAPCGLEPKSNKEWWNDKKIYLKELESCGVDYIIASHPFIMSLVKKHTGMKVVASTICEISSVRSALNYEEIGCDIIIPSMNVNYNLDTLRSIGKRLKHASLRIMLNEHCLGDCPWRRFHHNHYAHSNEEFDYHLHCKTMLIKNRHLMLTNNSIRPEDLKNYTDITCDFKIVGRLVPINDLVTRIKAYSEGHFEGNYISLFDSSLSKRFEIPNQYLNDLFERKSNCNKVCEECGYCIDLCNKIFV